jgi:hypothetical protein
MALRGEKYAMVGRVIRSLLAALVLLVSFDAVAAAPSPRSFMPANAGGIIVWKKPQATLAKIEELAAQSGSAPPGATPGWLEQSLAARTPMIADIDLSRPIWIGVMPESKKASTLGAEEPNPELVMVVAVKGEAALVREALSKEMNVTRRGDLLVAVDKRLPASLAQPSKKPFRFPANTNVLRSRSHLAGTVRLQAFPSIRDVLAGKGEMDDSTGIPPGMGPIVAAARQMQTEEWDQVEHISFGAGFAAAGVELFGQSHPKAGSKLAKKAKKRGNATGPLIRGLPPENYLLVGAVRTSPGAAAETARSTVASILGSSESIEPDIRQKLEELDEIAAKSGECSQQAFGVASLGALESLHFVGASRCVAAKSMLGSLRALARWGSEVVELIDAKDRPQGTAPRVRVRHEAGKQTVESVAFDEVRLEFGSDSPVDPDERELLQKPVVFGSVTPKIVTAAWNASPGQLERLVAAAKAQKAMTEPAGLRTARSGLLAPRHSEIFVFAGPIFSAFAPTDMASMMAPLRLLMAQMPPLSMAGQVQPDGSDLYQVVMPEQLVQMVAAFSQMMGPQ